MRDKEGKPVAGATISVKGKKINAVSGNDGAFSIAAASGDVLVASSVGYETYEIKVGSTGSSIGIHLATNASLLGDVVVVGYGTQRKKDLTGSVTDINIADTKKYTTSDISQLLQGRATGVAVNSDGQPGAGDLLFDSRAPEIGRRLPGESGRKEVDRS